MESFEFEPVGSGTGAIRNVVFDIGNVLSDFRWQEAIKDCGFPEETERKLAEAVFEGPLWCEYDRGVMGDEEVTAQIRKRCAGFEREFDLLYQNFAEFVRERPYAQPLLAALKTAGYHIYILSNYGDTMYRKNCRFFRFLPEADGAVFSYREKLIKPDSRIYEILLSRYDLEPGECLFLDDSAANAEAAKQIGMAAGQADSLDGILRVMKENGIALRMQ